MKLVIDASIFFVALIGKGVTKEIIFSDAIELFCPENLFDELEEHKLRILRLSGLALDKFGSLVEMLKNRMEVVPEEKFERFLEQANELISDKDDTAYLSLSLSLNRMPIWSNDLHFKEQSLVKVFNTVELVSKLKSFGYKLE